MYFKDRSEAGEKLAAILAPKYRYENCAVVALSDGAVLVGAQIAAQLHCVLTLLLTEAIDAPGEDVTMATIDSEGGFTYNGMFSAGQLEDYIGEYHGYLEQQKIEKLHNMNRLLGSGGIIERDLLRGHNVILVSDGLNSGVSLDAAAGFLKPIKMDKLIIAASVASVAAVDRMHILADEIYCPSVVENFVDTNHYYDNNDIPSREDTVKIIQDIVLQWR